MSPYASIRINNDLATCESTISFGSSDIKLTSRIYMEYYSRMEILTKYRRNHMFQNILAKIFLRYIKCMLCRQYNRVNTNTAIIIV